MALNCNESVLTEVYKSQRLLGQIAWLHVSSTPEQHTYFTQLK